MKAFGELERSQSWHEAYFFRIRAQGSLAELRGELDGLAKELDVRYRSTEQQAEGQENGVFGYLEGYEQSLLEAQRRLERMGWRRSTDL